MIFRHWAFVLAVCALVLGGSTWLFVVYGETREFSVILAVLTVLAIVAAGVVRRPMERIGAVALMRELNATPWRGLIIAAALVALAFLWLLVVFPYVPNTVFGVAVLFGPFFLFLLSGIGFGLYRVLRWIWR
jgi:hypothetical protein